MAANPNQTLIFVRGDIRHNVDPREVVRIRILREEGFTQLRRKAATAEGQASAPAENTALTSTFDYGPNGAAILPTGDYDDIEESGEDEGENELASSLLGPIADDEDLEDEDADEAVLKQVRRGRKK